MDRLNIWHAIKRELEVVDSLLIPAEAQKDFTVRFAKAVIVRLKLQRMAGLVPPIGVLLNASAKT